MTYEIYGWTSFLVFSNMDNLNLKDGHRTIACFLLLTVRFRRFDYDSTKMQDKFLHWINLIRIGSTMKSLGFPCLNEILSYAVFFNKVEFCIFYLKRMMV